MAFFAPYAVPMGARSCTCRLKRFKKGMIPRYQQDIADASAIMGQIGVFPVVEFCIPPRKRAFYYAVNAELRQLNQESPLPHAKNANLSLGLVHKRSGYYAREGPGNALARASGIPRLPKTSGIGKTLEGRQCLTT